MSSSAVSTHGQRERDGKGCVERSATAWPLGSNQTRSTGSSSMRGLRLHLPTRQRLLNPRTVIKPRASTHGRVRLAMLKPAARFSPPTHNLFSPSLLSLPLSRHRSAIARSPRPPFIGLPQWNQSGVDSEALHTEKPHCRNLTKLPARR